MTPHITINRHRMHLDQSPQTSPQGRPMRHSGTTLVTTDPKVWNDQRGYYEHPTVYWFRYLDAPSEFIGFKFDARGNFICKL